MSTARYVVDGALYVIEPIGSPGVEHEAVRRGQLALVHRAAAAKTDSSPTETTISSGGADQSGLALSSGQQLEQTGQAALVVGAEDRLALAVNHSVADDRLDPGVGAGRIHVERQQDRLGAVAIARGGERSGCRARRASPRTRALSDAAPARRRSPPRALSGCRWRSGRTSSAAAGHGRLQSAAPILCGSVTRRRTSGRRGRHPSQRVVVYAGNVHTTAVP